MRPEAVAGLRPEVVGCARLWCAVAALACLDACRGRGPVRSEALAWLATEGRAILGDLGLLDLARLAGRAPVDSGALAALRERLAAPGRKRA